MFFGGGGPGGAGFSFSTDDMNDGGGFPGGFGGFPGGGFQSHHSHGGQPQGGSKK